MRTIFPSSKLLTKLLINHCRFFSSSIAIIGVISLLGCTDTRVDQTQSTSPSAVQLGPRAFYLLDQLADGTVKQQLQQCRQGPFRQSTFSISHRGAGLQFPEHTKEAYLAAAKMGAGVIECDVTFTRDRQLVCRHAQCDLHRTTNILTKPELANKCSVPFRPADAVAGTSATALCCTSDISLAEFETLEGKMDGINPAATTIADYMIGTPNWRTDLYSASGTLMSFADSIDLFQSLGLKMTPELKAAEVPMPFLGEYTQQDYARQMVETLSRKRVNPNDVFMQSFSWPDIEYWINNHSDYAKQAVYLDGRVDNPEQLENAIESLASLHDQGLNIVAPPLWVLLSLNAEQQIVPSAYAIAAKKAELDIITWTLERSGHITTSEDYYYRSILPAIKTEGDIYQVLDVLNKDIGVLGVFSDWPAAVTYYANCMDLP